MNGKTKVGEAPPQIPRNAIETLYRIIEQSHKQGLINEEDYHRLLENFKFRDAQGRVWILRGARWIVRRGEVWVNGKPPEMLFPLASTSVASADVLPLSTIPEEVGGE